MTPLVHINAEAHVAAAYGLEEAIFLHSLMFWYRTNRGNGQNFHDGRWWTYNSVKTFEGIFPWWTGAQIRRIIARCREKGAMLAGNYNKDQRDRTAWYTPSDELLNLYGESVNCICQNEQMQASESADSFDGTSKPLPCSNHVETNMIPPNPPEGDASAPGAEPGSQPEAAPADKLQGKPRKPRRKKSVPDHAPERFEQFWQAYPVGGSRLKAVEAWDALAPSDELINEMALALKRQMRTQQWRDGIGIPHACRWLSNQRWTDKLPELPKPQSSGGWADDPEVTQGGDAISCRPPAATGTAPRAARIARRHTVRTGAKTIRNSASAGRTSPRARNGSTRWTRCGWPGTTVRG